MMIVLTRENIYIQYVYIYLQIVYNSIMVDIRALISSKIRIEILRILTVLPQNVYNINELSRLTAFSPRGVEKELKNLLSGGILRKEIIGNQHRFQLNQDCPVYSEIKSLIIKTVGVADVIRNALDPHEQEITYAFVYGSFASGDYGNESDIDLFVVTVLSGLKLTELMRSVQELTGRSINTAHFDPVEFERRKLEKDHFVSRVLEGPIIEIIGSSK